MPFVRQVKSFEGDTLEVIWHMADGTTFTQRVEIPPRPTREARAEAAPAPLVAPVDVTRRRYGIRYP